MLLIHRLINLFVGKRVDVKVCIPFHACIGLDVCGCDGTKFWYQLDKPMNIGDRDYFGRSCSGVPSSRHLIHAKGLLGDLSWSGEVLNIEEGRCVGWRMGGIARLENQANLGDAIAF